MPTSWDTDWESGRPFSELHDQFLKTGSIIKSNMSTEHTDTPETDAIWNKIIKSGCSLLSKEHKNACAETAKNGIEKLERERDSKIRLANRITREALALQVECDQLRARVVELEKSYPLLLAACVEFVRKVECGEARSRRSYQQMKEAIDAAKGKK